MSETTQPPRGGLHSTTPAAIGARLRSGHGCEVAKIFWFVILARTPWKGRDRSTWANNLTLGMDAGLMWSDPEHQAERALVRLRESGMLTTHNGPRPKARRKHGRILTPSIAAPVRILVPTRGQMTNLWLTCREARPRPAALVTLMTGMHILAAHELGRHPTDWAVVPGSRANLRRFVGASRGSTFDKRLRALESLELVRLERGIQIAPPAEWFQTFRAMRTFERERAAAGRISHAPEPEAVPVGHDPQWDLDPGWP